MLTDYQGADLKVIFWGQKSTFLCENFRKKSDKSDKKSKKSENELGL